MHTRFSLLLSLVAITLIGVSSEGIVPYSGDNNPYPQAADSASFCDRLLSENGYDYTNPDHAYSLMYLLVQRAYNGAVINGTMLPPVLTNVQGLKHNPNTVGYFDGTMDYRNTPSSVSPYKGMPTPNMKTNSVAAAALDDKIARFIGAGFGCTGSATDPMGYQTKYPPSNQSMIAIHSGMGITQLQFTAFINQFADSARSLGSTQYDFNLNVVPYLQSFGRGAFGSLGICVDSSCACATGMTGSNCDLKSSSTGVVVNPGEKPYPADLDGAASRIGGSMGLLALGAIGILLMVGV